MRQIYKISGIDCANCANKLESMIQKVDGVSYAQIDFIAERLVIEAIDDALSKVKKICSNFEDGVSLRRIK